MTPIELASAEAVDDELEREERMEMPGGRKLPRHRTPRAVVGLCVKLVETPVGGRVMGEWKASDSSGVVPVSLLTRDAFGRVDVAEYKLESRSSVSLLRREICTVVQSELLWKEDRGADDMRRTVGSLKSCVRNVLVQGGSGNGN
jgi:hypothetical protein